MRKKKNNRVINHISKKRDMVYILKLKIIKSFQ